MLENTTIQDWVRAAQAGEKTSWNFLHRQYYPGLYVIALRICNNNALAQDMVQDAFITAYLKLSQLKDTKTFGGWIKKILIHTCYRASHITPINNSLDRIPLESDSWWEDELNRKLDWLSTKNQLYTTLSLLPEVLRSTLLLRYFSAFQSYGEIAGILGIPVGTVRSRLNQAKLILAEKWKLHTDSGIKIFKDGEEWNKFYFETFSQIHHHDDCKNLFINHLQKDMEILFPGGKSNAGRWFFEYKIHDDRQFGSWCTPSNVLSSGNISIIETNHFNSPEHPHHCPLSSVMVVYRNSGKVNKMNLHIPAP